MYFLSSSKSLDAMVSRVFPHSLKKRNCAFQNISVIFYEYITVNVEYISNALNEMVGLLGQIVSFETNVIVMQAFNYVLAAC